MWDLKVVVAAATVVQAHSSTLQGLSNQRPDCTCSARNSIQRVLSSSAHGCAAAVATIGWGLRGQERGRPGAACEPSVASRKPLGPKVQAPKRQLRKFSMRLTWLGNFRSRTNSQAQVSPASQRSRIPDPKVKSHLHKLWSSHLQPSVVRES